MVFTIKGETLLRKRNRLILVQHTRISREWEKADTKLDAKLVLKQERYIFILEMAVRWINNREVKYQEKNEKYRNVLEQVEVEYPNYEVNHL